MENSRGANQSHPWSNIHDDIQKVVSLLGDRPIAFHVSFAKLTGSVLAGLMLSQAFYWQKRVKSKDGTFYKSGIEWEEETGLNRREQARARRILRQHSFWFEELRGVPATMYYRVDIESLTNELLGESIVSMTPEQIISNQHSVLVGLSKAGYMRAKKAGVKAEYVDYSEILIRDNGICGICHETIPKGSGQSEECLVFDHIIPIDAGGTHVFENIQCAHANCNSLKSNDPQFVYTKKTSSFSVNKQVDLSKTNFNNESENTSENTQHAQDKKRPARSLSKDEHAERVLRAVQNNAQRKSEGTPDFSWLDEYLQPYAQAFITEAGADYMPVKSERSFWRKTLRVWHDLEFRPDDIRDAVYFMRQNNLTIGGPSSLTKIMRNGKAQQAENSIPIFRAEEQNDH